MMPLLMANFQDNLGKLLVLECWTL